MVLDPSSTRSFGYAAVERSTTSVGSDERNNNTKPAGNTDRRDADTVGDESHPPLALALGAIRRLAGLACFVLLDLSHEEQTERATRQNSARCVWQPEIWRWIAIAVSQQAWGDACRLLCVAENLQRTAWQCNAVRSHTGEPA